MERIPSQLDASYNLYLSIISHRTTMLLSDVFEGKSTIIDIVLETFKISHPELSINCSKVNPSLLNIESNQEQLNFSKTSNFKNDKASFNQKTGKHSKLNITSQSISHFGERQNILSSREFPHKTTDMNQNKFVTKDSFSFLLNKLSLTNNPNNLNFIIFDSTICPSNFMDLLISYEYSHLENTPYNFVNTNKLGSEDSHKLDIKYIQTSSGKQYCIDKNTRPIIEVIDASNMSPDILTRLGVVSLAQSLNLTNMIKILHNKIVKFLEETLKLQDNVNFHDLVSEYITDFLTVIIEIYSKEFQYQLHNFNIRSIFLTFLNILKNLLKIPGDSIFENNTIYHESPDISKKSLIKNICNKEVILNSNESKNNTSHSEISLNESGDQSIISNESVLLEKENPTTMKSKVSEEPQEKMKSSYIELLMKSTVMAFFWSFGIILDSSARKKFNKIYIEYAIPLFKMDQDINFFDYYYDEKIEKMVKFVDNKHSCYFNSYNTDYILENHDMYVPTLQTMQTLYQIDGHLIPNNELNVAIVGNRFSGKSALIRYISSLVKSSYQMIKMYPILKQEQQQIYKLILENYKYNENEKSYKTLSGKFPLIIVDDVNIQPNSKGNKN